MKNFIYIVSIITLLSACGENAEEKTFIDKNIKSYLEYNEIASMTPIIGLSNVLTKMTEIKLQIQNYKFSKKCQQNVDYIVENMNSIQNMYKEFISGNKSAKYVYDALEAERILKKITESNSCKSIYNNIVYQKQLDASLKKELDDAVHPNIFNIVKSVYKGADINIRNTFDRTILMVVIAEEYPMKNKIIKWLIKKGANANAHSPHWGNALSYAVRTRGEQTKENLIELLDILIKNGANINIEDEKGDNALMGVSEDYLIKKLLDYGININHKNKEGKTALMTLCRANNSMDKSAGVKILIENGANISDTDNKGNNALMYACGYSISDDVKKYYNEYHPEVIQMLLEKGIDINAKNLNGRTALMYACENAVDINMIKLLLDNGADVNAEDMLKNTAYNYAEKNKDIPYQKIEELLNEAKKRNNDKHK